MPPVRRHRIGDQMPAVRHSGPDPSAIALCRDLVAEAAVGCAILFGSRAQGGWDEQSDLDIISSTRGLVMKERNVPSLAMPWTGSGSSTTRAIWTTKTRTTGWWTD